MHVQACDREHAPTRLPLRMPHLLWDFSTAHFPAWTVGGGLPETVGGDGIEEGSKGRAEGQGLSCYRPCYRGTFVLLSGEEDQGRPGWSGGVCV